MILVSRPYFNEPGYGDPTDSAASLQYSRNVRHNVIKWAMLKHLKDLKESKGFGVFENALKTHFLLKRERILLQVQEWQSHYQKGDDLFPGLVEELKQELYRL